MTPYDIFYDQRRRRRTFLLDIPSLQPLFTREWEDIESISDLTYGLTIFHHDP